ncbi:MAG: efflux RND transporter permease subunit [Pseudomonadota bacterium]
MKFGTGSILAYFTRHGTAANLALVLMLVAGIVAATEIRSQFLPDVVVDTVRVDVRWNGAGPEDIDRAIVGLMEPALLAVEGVEETTSVAYEGQARITMEFEPGWDIGRATDDVKAAVDRVDNLPSGAETPVVVRGQWRDRVTDVVIYGPVSPAQLGDFADEFTAMLFREGITRTTVRGVANPVIRIAVPEMALIQHDVALQDVATAVAAAAETNPAGDIAGGGARVRTGVERRTAEDLGSVVVRTLPDGAKLYVRDLADVELEGVDRGRAYFNGELPAVSIRIDRSSNGDAIGIQRTVEEVAAELQPLLPAGVEIELIRTRAEAISERLSILLDNGLIGLGLVLALLFVFLNFRTAFWVAAGIPAAMLATVALMYAFGFTLNMISLFALIISLGIVVDDAIVVGEHADFRHRRLGEDPVTASIRSAERMAAPVFSASVTTVIAFTALTLVGGRFGALIVDIPFTVAIVLIASLIECFLILPNHMSHALDSRRAGLFWSVTAALFLAFGLTSFLQFVLGFAVLGPEGLIAAPLSPLAALGANTLVTLASLSVLLRILRAVGLDPFANAPGPWYDEPSRRFNLGFVWVRGRFYRPLVAVLLRFRYPVLAAAILVLAGAVSMLISREVPWRFFNAPERGSISANIAMLPGATRDDTTAMVRELQRATNAVAERYAAEHGRNPLDFALAEVGGTTGRGLAGQESKDADLLGAVAIELIDADLRPYSSFAFVAALEEEVVRHPLLETLSFRSWRSGPGDDGLHVQLFGPEAETLKRAAEDLKAALTRFPEVSALEDDMSYDKTELILDLTPQGQALGFTLEGVGAELRARLNGIDAAEFAVGLRTAKVVVRLPEEELTSDFLSRTHLRSSSGAFVPLSEIVTVDQRFGFSIVQRENSLRLVRVTGDVSEDDPERANEITALLSSDVLPAIAARHGVSYVVSGLAEQEREFLTDALLGFLLCLLGIYLTLAWIFASWARPIVVMAIIPFGLIGTIWGHHIWDVPMSMFTVIGLIGMTGIIINDSIVLVTTVDEYSARRGLMAAIVDASADRLRPVLLTTLTTVMGLAPLLYETSQQAQFLRPTVITLVYGLGAGVVLVLLIVPALIAVQFDVKRLMTAYGRSVRAEGGMGRQRLVMRTATAAALACVAFTVGVWAVTGTVSRPVGWLSAQLPMLSGGGAAFFTMVLGLLAILATAFVAASLLTPSRQRRSRES